jgi:uncharacterized OB-fold protein
MSTTATEIDLPEPSPELTQFREALGEGQLRFQRCSECANAWLPPRDQCPRCLSPEFTWEDASGAAKVVSWVVYHRAFHPAFADRVPYNVTVVELAEGPRLISNVLGISAADGLAIDTPLTVAIETEGDVPVARFRLT